MDNTVRKDRQKTKVFQPNVNVSAFAFVFWVFPLYNRPFAQLLPRLETAGHPVTVGQLPAYESHSEQSEKETRKTAFCSSETLKSYAGDWPIVTRCPVSNPGAIIVQMVYYFNVKTWQHHLLFMPMASESFEGVRFARRHWKCANGTWFEYFFVVRFSQKMSHLKVSKTSLTSDSLGVSTSRVSFVQGRIFAGKLVTRFFAQPGCSTMRLVCITSWYPKCANTS